MGDHIGSPLQEDETVSFFPVGAGLRAGPKRKRKTLSQIVAWYKTMTTNAYIRGVKNNGWQRYKDSLWQRSFYDHIIRSEKTLDNIRDYISFNQVKWEYDAENKKSNIDKEKYYKKLY